MATKARGLDLERCKTGRDFLRYAEHNGGRVDHQTGSHAIVRGPGGGTCPVPMHNGDLPTGTRHSIIKRLITIGLGVCALAWLFGPAIEQIFK